MATALEPRALQGFTGLEGFKLMVAVLSVVPSATGGFFFAMEMSSTSQPEEKVCVAARIPGDIFTQARVDGLERR